MKSMHIALTALGSVTVVLLAACSGPSEDSASVPACTDSPCIGLVVESGSVDDGAFYSAAWEGVQQAGELSGGTALYLSGEDSSAYKANIEAFAAAGYDIVVTTGVDAPEVTEEVAERFPETRFIGISQDMSEAPDNATGLVFSDDQPGFAAGYLAGLMSQTGVVGAVLGSEAVIPLKRFGEGYRQGALAAQPGITVLMDYNPTDGDSFNDPEWGAATAQKQLDQGADVIFGAGGTTGTGALIAVAQAPGAGQTIFCIGIDVDQYETVPEARPCLLTSAEKKIAQGVTDAAMRLINGENISGNVPGAVGLAPYHDADARVPDQVKQRLAQVVEQLSQGSLNTGVDF